LPTCCFLRKKMEEVIVCFAVFLMKRFS
jgi:hypothetical protein